MRIKICIIILLLIISLSLFSCDNDKKDDGKLDIVITIFPEYDWVKNIVEGDPDVNLTLLLDSGSDLHSYNPTAKDIITLQTCDLLIYTGGESDNWVNNVFAAAPKEIPSLNLLDSLGDKAKEEEELEGVESEEEEEETEYDEHIWLSLKNASYLVDVITNRLVSLNPNSKDLYENNAKAYKDKINQLDLEYENKFKEIKNKVVLFADRFPFRYLVDDYDITYYAAFKGCQADSEASAQTISFLANKVAELELNNIFVLETSDKKIARTVIETSKRSNVIVLVLNSLQSSTLKNYDSGNDYLKLMEENLKQIYNSFN